MELPNRRSPRAGASSTALVGLGAVLAVVLGLWLADGGDAAGSELDAGRVVAVTRRDLLDAVTASGRVEPVARVAVMSRASGIIEVLHVDEGDVVEKGQVLAELDREQLEAAVEGDRADLQSAEARVAAARAAVTEARLALQDPELQFLEREADRLSRLHEAGDVSLQSKEDAARALANGQFAIQRLEARIPGLDAAILEAQANLASASASLERSETTLSEATILSPIDGIVLVRDREVGDGVSSILTAGGNATQIFSLGDLSRMHVEARVDEVDLGRIRTGMPAVITVDAHRGKSLEGVVERIAPAGSVDDNGIVTFEVRVAVEDPERLLKPDMTADAKLVLARKDAILTLPQRALRTSGKQRDGAAATWFVDVVEGSGEDASIQERAVEIGLSDGLMTEIVSGLEEGESVRVPLTGNRGR